MAKYHTSNLDQFVRSIDEAGGLATPEAQKFLIGFELEFDTKVDLDLDPYSDEYMQQQLDVYREISGRSLDQSVNEMTDFDMERHVAAPNAYATCQPTEFVLHYLRIGQAVRQSALPVGRCKVLDFGAGWGMSTEFLATLGCDVTAVDINSRFVELVTRRAARLGLPIKAVQSGFDEFDFPERYDLVFFYECLHHAVRPWELLAKCAKNLKPNGKIAFGGEPIQDYWWPTWGIRLDPISVFCIRKFGWFESGWSESFIQDMFVKCGMTLTMTGSRNDPINYTGVASFNLDSFATDGWIKEPQFFVSTGDVKLKFPEKNCTAFTLDVTNFRPSSIELVIEDEDTGAKQLWTLPTGESKIPLPNSRSLRLRSDQWVPHEEIGNDDARTLSFHVRSINPS